MPTELKQPADWWFPGVRAAFHLVVGAAGAVVVAVAVVRAARDPAARLLWLGIGAFGALGVFNAVEYGPWFGRGAEPVSRGGGLELPFSLLRAWAGLLRTVTLVGLGLGSLLAGGRRGILPGLVLVLVGVLLRTGSQRLVLTPEAVTYTRGRRTWTLPWSDGVDVAADSDPVLLQGPKEWYIVLTSRRPAVTRGRAYGVESARVDADAFAVDPVVAYWTLRFYADHPEARPELADARAVDRVARRDLQAPPAPGG